MIVMHLFTSPTPLQTSSPTSLQTSSPSSSRQETGTQSTDDHDKVSSLREKVENLQAQLTSHERSHDRMAASLKLAEQVK